MELSGLQECYIQSAFAVVEFLFQVVPSIIHFFQVGFQGCRRHAIGSGLHQALAAAIGFFHVLTERNDKILLEAAEFFLLLADQFDVTDDGFKRPFFVRRLKENDVDVKTANNTYLA